MVTFHDPRAELAVAAEPYGLSVDLRRLNDPCLGLLANGFPDSERFLDRVGEALHELMPTLKWRTYNKGDASSPAPDAMLEDIREACQGAVAAYGH